MPSDSYIYDVSPEIAANWLRSYWCPLPERWPYYDGPGLRLVESFIGSMERGKWNSLTPKDPIKIGHLNELFDGRARLLAVYRSGITVQMTVAGGYYYDEWFDVHEGEAKMLMHLPGAQ